jgi:hypothetical protein
MAKLSKDYSAGNLHSRETLFTVASIGTVNGEIVLPSDSSSAVMVDLRGTFSMTLEVSGTVDGTNWTPIPMRPINQALKRYVAAITGTVAGVWAGACAGYKSVRIRCTAYTSGACTTTIAASSIPLDQSLDGMITTDVGTNTGASGAAVTLTLAAPGAGLRHYLTYIEIARYAAAVLTASATPVIITTTNIPTSLVFTFPADAAALGTLFPLQEDFSFPLMTTAQNTATTIVCPATTGVIWRVTAGYYIAP